MYVFGRNIMNSILLICETKQIYFIDFGLGV